METIKLEWEMYWILYEIKREFDIKNIKEDFQTFAKKKIENLYKKWIEMLADDERESSEIEEK